MNEKFHRKCQVIAGQSVRYAIAASEKQHPLVKYQTAREGDM
jgi:hypothetical protein